MNLSGAYNIGEPYFTTDTGMYFIAKSATELVQFPNKATLDAALASIDARVLSLETQV